MKDRCEKQTFQKEHKQCSKLNIEDKYKEVKADILDIFSQKVVNKIRPVDK